MGYAKDLENKIGRMNNQRTLNAEELAHMQKVLLDCYLDIQSVCDKYGLSVMLVGGSCLGAVRHGGFIPWDDDFDIGMPREDYEKFSSVFEKELGSKYTLNAPNKCSDALDRFPKVLINGTKFTQVGHESAGDNNAIKVDIFIIENVPDNSIVRYFKGMRCQVLMYIASCVNEYNRKEQSVFLQTEEGRKLFRRRARVAKLFSFKNLHQWFDAVDTACMYKEAKTKYVSLPSGTKHYFGEMLPADVMTPVSKVKFGDADVYLPNKPEKYLENRYGADYIDIPPVEDREVHYISELDFGEW